MEGETNDKKLLFEQLMLQVATELMKQKTTAAV
jgi:hypothetical protein